MLNKISNSKRGQIFAYLDIISIIVLVIIIVALLIYINVSNKKEQKKVELLTEGVNLPHYIMNIFQSEVIDMSNCYLEKTNATRIDALIWLNYMKEQSDKDEYKICLENFANSLTRFNDADLGNVEIDFDFILEDKLLFSSTHEFHGVTEKSLFVREFHALKPGLVSPESYIVIPYKDKFLTYGLTPNVKYFEITIPAKIYGESEIEEIKIFAFYKAIDE